MTSPHEAGWERHKTETHHKTESKNAAQSCGKSYVFQEGDSLRMCLEKMGLPEQNSTTLPHSEGFFQDIQDSVTKLLHGDEVKLTAHPWNPAPDYEFCINRNGQDIYHFNFTDRIVRSNTERKWHIMDTCKSALGDLKNMCTNNSTPTPEKMEQEQKQKQEILESVGGTKEGVFCGITDAPPSETVKILKKLSLTESMNLLKKIFGEWAGTDLLIAIDRGSSFAIKRMIVLANHEGKLKFGCQNKDPRSGNNVGTFQIGWIDSTPDSSMGKYKSCLQTWMELAKNSDISIKPELLKNNPAQLDLLAHLWYIQSERGGSETFEKLADPNLSEKAVEKLLSHRIQQGSASIGKSVVSQMNKTKIDTSVIT